MLYQRLLRVLTLVLPLASTYLSASPIQAEEKLNVMSQNLYIGVDIMGIIDIATVFNLPKKASAMYKTILNSGYEERTKKLAQRIAEIQPDLLGLQEVIKFMRQSPGDFYLGNPVKSGEVELDFLTLLLAALKHEGLSYEVASIHENAEAEFPVYHNLDQPSADEPLDDIRFMDRDVILVKSGLNIVGGFQKTFDSILRVPVRNPAVRQIKRGFHGVIVNYHAKNILFVNTHLEIKNAVPFLNIQYHQALEISRFLATFTLPTILLGDFNDVPTTFRRSPYRVITGQRFIDAWQVAHPDGQDGFTCCHREDLRNEQTELKERIDYVFYKNAPPEGDPWLQAEQSYLLNHTPEDKTSSGLWFSDHAGLVASFRLTH